MLLLLSWPQPTVIHALLPPGHKSANAQERMKCTRTRIRIRFESNRNVSNGNGIGMKCAIVGKVCACCQLAARCMRIFHKANASGALRSGGVCQYAPVLNV